MFKKKTSKLHIDVIQITWDIELLIQQALIDHKFFLAPTFDLEYIVSPSIGSFQKFLIVDIELILHLSSHLKKKKSLTLVSSFLR